MEGTSSGMKEGGVVSTVLNVSTEDVDLVPLRTAGRLKVCAWRSLALLAPGCGLSLSNTLSFLAGSSSLLDRSFVGAEVGGDFADCGVGGLDDSADCVACDAFSSTVTVMFVNTCPPQRQYATGFRTSFLLRSRVCLCIGTVDNDFAVLLFHKWSPFEVFLVSAAFDTPSSTLLTPRLLFTTFESLCLASCATCVEAAQSAHSPKCVHASTLRPLKVSSTHHCGTCSALASPHHRMDSQHRRLTSVVAPPSSCPRPRYSVVWQTVHSSGREAFSSLRRMAREAEVICGGRH